MSDWLGRYKRAFRWIVRGPSPLYLGDYTILLRTALGYRLFVDSRDVSLTPILATDGVWEPDVTRLIDSRLKPGMQVADVGSNVGYHAVHMAYCVGETGHVNCFEANPRLAALLARSLEMNSVRERSTAHAMAAGDSVGEAEFKVFDRHLGSSSFLVADQTAADYHDSITRITVPVTTLDAALAHVKELHFLKVDAEGAEPRVIAGAKEIIARSPNLEMLLEFGPAFFPSLADAKAFLVELQGMGFSMRRLTKDGTLEKTNFEQLLDATALFELFLTRRSLT